MSQTNDALHIHLPPSIEMRHRTEEARERARRARHHTGGDVDREAELEVERGRRLGAADVRHRFAGLSEVAERGEFQLLIDRFPSDLCNDRGRAINNNDDVWPETLAGVSRQLYEFWQEALRDLGYGISARILDYPDGIPGDAGLFLTWR